MKLIKTKNAIGQVLHHDITQIVAGVRKSTAFRKGHVVREEDIPVLLSIGKENLYVWEANENMLHENDAAEILCAICKGKNIGRSEVREGKIELTASCDGLLKIDVAKLNRINSLGEMMIAARHGNFPVRAGDKLAGTRVIPLVIEREKMERVKKAAGDEPIFSVWPYQHRKVGIVTTGSEVYEHRIDDFFTPVIRRKLEEFPTEVVAHIVCNDEQQMITAAIKECLGKGAEVIICTGGMSVDPDDRTPLAITNSGARIVTYGAAVLPGAMFLLGYLGRNIPIMGLPGCVMYAKRTIFDLVLPRIMAGEILGREDVVTLGQGGLCLSCPVCTFPNCGFGKGTI